MPRKSIPSSLTAQGIFPKRLQALMDCEPKTTQPQLAKALGVQRQTVSNYANGQSSPDWHTLAAISKYFHVSADYLLGLSDDPHVSADSKATAQYLGLMDYEAGRLHRLLSKKEYREVFSGLIFGESMRNLLQLIRETSQSFERIQNALPEKWEIAEHEARHIQRDLAEDLAAELAPITGLSELQKEIKEIRDRSDKEQAAEAAAENYADILLDLEVSDNGEY